jgi:hypothetical protein
MKNKFHEYINTQIKESNPGEVSFLLYGILADLIFEREYFTKNRDIEKFTTDILQEHYKEYLFASRTSLYARIVKDIKLNINNDKEKFIKKATNIKGYLREQEKIDKENDDITTIGLSESTLKRKTSGKSDPIDEWRKIINSKKE